MKLAIRGMCAVTLALIVLGLGFYLSAGSLAGTSAVARESLASAIVDIGSKIAIAIALVAAMIAGQRSQWRWVAGLLAAIAAMLFLGPLGALTHSGVVLYFVGPIAITLAAAAYTARMGSLGASYRIGDNGRSVAR